MMKHDKMKVSIMTDIKQLEFTERAVSAVGPQDVLVKVEAVGICGSDLHYFEHGRIGNYIVKPPFVLGHEASGVVVEVGPEVTHLKVGDRVALEPGITCGECEFCKSGKYNLCPDVVFFATPPVDGVLQEYVAHPAALSFKLPEHLTALEGAMVEPLAVGLHAAKQGQAAIGQTAVVTGTGCIGLMSLLALKAVGISKVIVVDVIDKRLAKARELGAFATINAATEDVVTRVLELTDGKGCDLVIETAGLASTTNQAIQYVKKGSHIVLVGYSKEGHRDLQVELAMDKELTFDTVFRYRHLYPLAIEAIASGLIPVRDVVTHEFEFDDVQRAFTESLENKADIVKSVVYIR